MCRALKKGACVATCIHAARLRLRALRPVTARATLHFPCPNRPHRRATGAGGEKEGCEGVSGIRHSVNSRGAPWPAMGPGWGGGGDGALLSDGAGWLATIDRIGAGAEPGGTLILAASRSARLPAPGVQAGRTQLAAAHVVKARRPQSPRRTQNAGLSGNSRARAREWGGCP